MKKYLAIALALFMIAAILPGCSGVAEAKPNFQLLVSDEPNDIGNFYSVNVTISQIGLYSADTDNWTTCNVTRTFDLTTLKGDNATRVWDGLIASGNYTKVFIYVDNVVGVLKDGEVAGDNATVKLPGGKLQISKPFTISQVDGSSIVSFVFDITIIKAGESGKYILKPQIGASGVIPFNDVTPIAQGKGKNSSANTHEPNPQTTVADQHRKNSNK